ncbi:MAG: IS1595 family transposase [Candidatus Sulfotelmatobacter sp.]
MKATAQHEIFTDETKAIEFWESKRWPDGAVCPHCGLVGEAYKLQGKSTRPGLWKCKGCRKPFTAKMRSIFEDSHIPMHVWMYAVHLLCSSKKGMSAYQFHRMTATFYGKKVSYRTAWFMFHRIRFAMTQHPLVEKLAGIVECDETYVGGKIRVGTYKPRSGRRPKYRSPRDNKAAVFAVLQRDGDVRSRHIQRVTAENLKPVIEEMIAEDAHVMTDSSTVLSGALSGRKHDQVNHHRDEYVRYEDGKCITTNSVEGYFSLLKRGIYGTYHHVGKPYLQQYLNEFDFRYNNRKVTDMERTDVALKATEGKRLTLRRPIGIQ